VTKRSAFPVPACHLAHIPGPPGTPAAAVWICEHPYPTMRVQGPSSECEGCPVWRRLQEERARHVGSSDSLTHQLV